MSEQDHTPGYTTGSAEREGRDVRAPVQLIHLTDLAAQVSAERQRRNVDHTAYTLRNAVALRQVLIAIGPNGRMQDHHVDGGVAIQMLTGEVAVEVEDTTYVLGQGDLLDLAPGLTHNLHGRSESIILLTIAPVGSVAHPSAPQL